MLQLISRNNFHYFYFYVFCNFLITQILRGINFGDSRNAKSAILTHFEAMNFDIFESLHLQKNEIYQIDKLQSIQNGSNGIFFTF